MVIGITGASGLIGSSLVEAFRADGRRVVRLVRPGRGLEADAARWDPQTGEVEELPTLGIAPAEWIALVPPREWVGPGEALMVGIDRTWAIISRTLVFVGDMIFTDADTSGLGGPIGIAQISGEQAQEGVIELIGLIGLISTSIGLINLFPIPILDGGHLMFYAVEAVRGRPLSETWMQVGNWIGLSLVLFLMTVSYTHLTLPTNREV